MSHSGRLSMLGLLVLVVVVSQSNAAAQNTQGQNGQINKVFVIAMENHNWTQPNPAGSPQQVFQNPNAPFINSLVTGPTFVVINGQQVNISQQTAYAANYHNVLATDTPNNPHVHPSEPNYVWAEAGYNFRIGNDADPFVPNGSTNQVNNLDNQLHLTTLLTQAGRTWKSYQEDIDLTTVNGQLTNVVAPPSQWTSPIVSFSGIFAAGTNQFNGSAQFNYAVKHNPMAFFTDSNGGDDTTPANPLSHQYAPLQQLFVDLANNTVADYNWITPDQYNDMHTTLTGGFQGVVGDAANIKQGDNFLSIIIPQIMASQAYKNNGAIIIWWDESESNGPGDNGDDLNHTIGEIVISPLAHPNEGGQPFASQVFLTHSSDVRSLQEIFCVTKPFFLGDAVHATDLSSLFVPGAIPCQNQQ